MVNNEAVAAFLLRNGVDLREMDAQAECRRFMDEMERGLQGEGSLRMIPTYLPVSKTLPKNTAPLLVLDAGGTNLRSASVRFENGQAVVEDFSVRAMPGSRGAVDRSEFFDALADSLAPIAGKSGTVAFCFSYPAQPLQDGDSEAVFMSKGVEVRGLVGARLGRGLQEAMAAHGLGSKRVLVLNDAVATMFAGMAGGYAACVGFILGTGSNTCYVQSPGVGKLSGVSSPLPINTESGGYALFPRGEIDLAYDKTTGNPGVQTFEKMISGKYQGGLTLTALRHAAGEGLFSSECAWRLANLKVLHAKEIDTFLDQKDMNALDQCCAAEADRSAMRQILEALAERTAKLVSIDLAASLLKSSGAKSGGKLGIALDGSVCHHSRTFREKLRQEAQALLGERLGLPYALHDVQDGSLLGAAVAGALSLEPALH